MWKASTNGNGEALLVLNKDPWNGQHLHCDDLYRHVQSANPLRDVSPEWPMEYLPTPLEYDMNPGMARVIVNSAD
jgi:starch synthase (maltosyl-transferring)